MSKILPNLPQFGPFDNKPIIFNEEGKWKIPQLSSRFVSKITLDTDGDKTLLEFHRVLQKIETCDLYFGAPADVMEKQAKFYRDVIQRSRLVVQLHQNAASDHTKELCSTLEMSIIKLQYRIQAENAGLTALKPDEIDPNMVQDLKLKVEEQKNKDEKYEYTQKLHHTAQIREICKYPELVKFILDPAHKKQCDEYLQRSIRDNFSIDALSQYHYESKQLSDNFIACRTGAIARKLISVDLIKHKNGVSTKSLNFLMENRKINLLNKTQRIRFSNGLVWKLSRIYKDFREKNDKPGELEMMWNGVTPFNGHEISHRVISKKRFLRRFKFTQVLLNQRKKYAPLNTVKPRWFEKTPILDIRSKKYIEARYNVKIKPGQWVTILEATRRNELDVDKAHGYSLFYQPIGNNQYRVYSFGAFPLKFPQNTPELAEFIGNTVRGTVAFDPNYFYSQSQKASWPKVRDEKVALALLSELGRHKKRGIIFQLGWENCAYFMRNVFEKIFKEMKVDEEIPQFFEKKFLHVKPRGALQIVQTLFKTAASKDLLPIIKLALAILFGAMRSITVLENGRKVKKSLWKSPFFKQLKINVPSAMHYRIKKDRIAKVNNPNYQEKFANCVLNYGHMRNIKREKTMAAAA